MKVSIVSLGCKVNQSEGEELLKEFAAYGIAKAGKKEIADIAIVNTCTVTGEADRKSRKLIYQAVKNKERPDQIVIVTGCYAEVDGESLRAIPGVDLVVGQSGKEGLVKRVLDEIASAGSASHLAMTESPDVKPTQGFSVSGLRSPVNHRHRAYLKIQDGCDNRCAYCIVPDARGKPRSLPVDEVLTKAAGLIAGGVREIVLTGTNIGKYCSDEVASSRDFGAPRNDGKGYLTRLIRKLMETPGLERIRLSSIEPEDLTDELIRLLGIEKIGRLKDWEIERLGDINLPSDRKPYLCPHLHVPLQSGDEETLKRMGRRYSAGEYREMVEKVRAANPDVAITTDVIVGFPGETEEAFDNTYHFLEKAELARLHVFKYSKRKGTPAAEMTGQIPEKVKAERSERLRKLSLRLGRKYRKKFIGRELDVLVEKASGHRLTGTSDNYLTVEFDGEPKMVGQLVKVKLQD